MVVISTQNSTTFQEFQDKERCSLSSTMKKIAENKYALAAQVVSLAVIAYLANEVTNNQNILAPQACPRLNEYWNVKEWSLYGELNPLTAAYSSQIVCDAIVRSSDQNSLLEPIQDMSIPTLPGQKYTYLMDSAYVSPAELLIVNDCQSEFRSLINELKNPDVNIKNLTSLVQAAALKQNLPLWKDLINLLLKNFMNHETNHNQLQVDFAQLFRALDTSYHSAANYAMLPPTAAWTMHQTVYDPKTTLNDIEKAKEFANKMLDSNEMKRLAHLFLKMQLNEVGKHEVTKLQPGDKLMIRAIYLDEPLPSTNNFLQNMVELCRQIKDREEFIPLQKAAEKLKNS